MGVLDEIGVVEVVDLGEAIDDQGAGGKRARGCELCGGSGGVNRVEVLLLVVLVLRGGCRRLGALATGARDGGDGCGGQGRDWVQLLVELVLLVRGGGKVTRRWRGGGDDGRECRVGWRYVGKLRGAVLKIRRGWLSGGRVPWSANYSNLS